MAVLAAVAMGLSALCAQAAIEVGIVGVKEFTQAGHVAGTGRVYYQFTTLATAGFGDYVELVYPVNPVGYEFTLSDGVRFLVDGVKTNPDPLTVRNRIDLTGLAAGTWYVIVTRAGLSPDPAPGFLMRFYLPDTGCQYTVSPTSQSFGADGGSGTISVGTRAQCGWIALSSASWITVDSGSAGTGNGSVAYSVSRNTEGRSRSGAIVIGDRTVLISQAACNYAISPTSRSHGPGAESGSFSVTTGSGCTWSASGSVGWIQITAGETGAGSGTVYYSLRPNYSTNSRSGTITVENRTFSITQARDDGTTAPTITSQPTNQITKLGGTARFRVTAVGSEPLSFQWRFNGAAISGATTDTLTLSNVAFTSAGTYTVVVSNRAGVVTSQPATLEAREQTPFNGTPWNVPGIIQAENFDNGGPQVAYLEFNVSNAGRTYRPEPAGLEPCSDAGGGYNLGYTSGQEWWEYTVNVRETGTYVIELRVASSGRGGQFHLDWDDARLSNFEIPDTGGWQNWRTIRRNVANNFSSPVVRLEAGVHRLRLACDTAGPSGAGGNINYIRIAPATSVSNTQGILVPGENLFGVRSWGNGDPYPSSVSVPSASGKVAKVIVRLSGFWHQDPPDVDLLLRAPGGPNVILMADAGGDAVYGRTLEFDDDATAPPPASLESGIYRPAGGTYSGSTTSDSIARALSVFQGRDPQGNWALYAYDDDPIFAGGLDTWELVVVRTFEEAPFISDITDKATARNRTVGPIPFTAGDDTTPPGNLILSASSSNPALVPNGSIRFGGAGADRTVSITPAANGVGTTTITLFVRDTAGLISSEQFVVTVVDGPLSNLVPIRPQGWSDKLTVSATTNSITDGVVLFDNQDLYLSWAIINAGTAPITNRFHHRLYVDGQPRRTWHVDTLQPAYYNYFIDFSLGRLSPGPHVLRLVADFDFEVAETNETDNAYEKIINVTSATAPPRLSAVRRQPSGAVELAVQGPPGRRYEIQAATNLMTGPWTALGVVTNQTGQAQFTDAAAAGLPRRFYRARVLEP